MHASLTGAIYDDYMCSTSGHYGADIGIYLYYPFWNISVTDEEFFSLGGGGGVVKVIVF